MKQDYTVYKSFNSNCILAFTLGIFFSLSKKYFINVWNDTVVWLGTVSLHMHCAVQFSLQ